MGTPAYLLFCLCFGVLVAAVWLLWRYRSLPSIGTIRGDFARQQRESTPYGRVLYPLFVAGLLVLGATAAGIVERAARGAVGFALGFGPLMLVGWLLPRRSQQ